MSKIYLNSINNHNNPAFCVANHFYMHALSLINHHMQGRHQEVHLTFPNFTCKHSHIFRLIEKEDWYKPDVFMYKDMIICLAKGEKMEEAKQVWDSMKEKELFPDSQTYAEVLRGFLRFGSPADAMNIYEDMRMSPDPPEELPFRVLLKGLVPHPLLRNRVKQDFEELFPDRHIYDPLEETFGIR